MRSSRLLFKAAAAGAVAATAFDYMRGRSIQQYIDTTSSETPTPEQSLKFKDAYEKLVPNFDNKYQLSVYRDPAVDSPFSVDSLSHKHALLMLPKTPMPIDYELAMAAHEAAHTRESHAIIKDFSTFSFVAYCVGKGFLSGKPTLNLATSLLAVYLGKKLLSQQLELRADKLGVLHMPNTFNASMHLLTKGEKFLDPKTSGQAMLESLTSDHPSFFRRKNNLLQSHLFQIKNELPSEFFPIRSISQNLRDTLTEQKLKNTDVDSESIIKHPLTKQFYQGLLPLSPAQRELILRCEESVRVYVTADHEAALKTFYNEMKASSTPLGEYYRTLSFDQFMHRLVFNRYASAYLNGNMLKARKEDDNLGKLLQGKTGDISLNRNILETVGTKEDTAQIFKEYLSLEEIAAANMLLIQGMVIPIGDGRRGYEYLEEEDRVVWDIQDSLSKAITTPIVLSDIAGIECRNGTTLHYDLFMVAKPVEPTEYWHKRAQSVAQSPFMSIAPSLFGSKTALSTTLDTAKIDPDFIRVKTHQGDWMLCKPAYKYRIKQTLQQTLLAADHMMREQQLDTSFNLKGLGLGAFGFHSAGHELEEIYLDALTEVLNENKLSYIQQINLTSLPSENVNHDMFVETTKPQAMKPWKTVHNIQISKGYSNSLANAVPGAGMIGGTHICGDSATQFGNEFNAGVGPSSSDEAAIAHQILMPYALLPSHNKKFNEKVFKLEPETSTPSQTLALKK